MFACVVLDSFSMFCPEALQRAAVILSLYINDSVCQFDPPLITVPNIFCWLGFPFLPWKAAEINKRLGFQLFSNALVCQKMIFVSKKNKQKQTNRNKNPIRVQHKVTKRSSLICAPGGIVCVRPPLWNSAWGMRRRSRRRRVNVNNRGRFLSWVNSQERVFNACTERTDSVWGRRYIHV